MVSSDTRVRGPEVYAVLHHPRMLSAHSGMDALAEAVGARAIRYAIEWERLQARSWTAGQWLRRWGNAHYGSEWNALVPWRDERRFLRDIPRGSAKVVHFLWAEFARPRSSRAYRDRNAALVGTFHASARKQPSVIRDPRVFEVFDRITLMSESQKAFFLERGYPAERVRVILHGVDSAFFTPGPDARGEDGRPLRALLVGKTERDHEFMADVARAMPDGLMELSVCTSREQAERYYRDAPRVKLLPRLNDEELKAVYQSADILLMPIHDCAANNVVLEAMACGTPVMANRAGGIAEYMGAECGILMERKRVDEWVDALRVVRDRRGQLRELGRAARRRAESLGWRIVAEEYKVLYREALASR